MWEEERGGGKGEWKKQGCNWRSRVDFNGRIIHTRETRVDPRRGGFTRHEVYCYGARSRRGKKGREEGKGREV